LKVYNKQDITLLMKVQYDNLCYKMTVKPKLGNKVFGCDRGFSTEVAITNKV